ncbi:MAG: hypothetical protein HYY04_14980 [Chloroflexi bacterium]|nr:hypothetical protein [Chloroflexota bacterium]
MSVTVSPRLATGSRLAFHPTAGAVMDVARGAEPGPLDREERAYLRELARRVAAIAHRPKQAEKRDLWYRHNRLEKVRPLILVFPEDSWYELLPDDTLRVADRYWRQWEWYLCHLIYRDERLPDDFVVEPVLDVTSVVRQGNWGVETELIRPEDDWGAYRWEAPVRGPDDLDRLTYPTIEVDEEATRQRLEAVGELFGDLLPIRLCGVRLGANLIGTVCRLLGLNQVMVDMYDRPGLVHALMEHVTRGTLRMLDYLEVNGHLTLNNRNHYTDSGGIGYTDELPASGSDGRRVGLGDLWGFGVAQELALVSPAQHEEFVLQYQLRVLERFGLNAYGCCESLDRKFEMLKRVPRLRRVSVSPWCNQREAADKLGDRCIFSRKPNPALLVGQFDPEVLRADVRQTLEIARDCVLEMILKDTFTVQREPERLTTWIRIAREEIERVW